MSYLTAVDNAIVESYFLDGGGNSYVSYSTLDDASPGDHTTGESFNVSSGSAQGLVVRVDLGYPAPNSLGGYISGDVTNTTFSLEIYSGTQADGSDATSRYYNSSVSIGAFDDGWEGLSDISDQYWFFQFGNGGAFLETLEITDVRIVAGSTPPTPTNKPHVMII